MNKILAFSGKKQSGKNTSFNFLLGLELLKLSVVRDQMEIRSDGKLFVSDIFGDTSHAGIFNTNSNIQAVIDFNSEYVYPFIKEYSFADNLKKNVCIDLLGLSWEQCYGTNEEKNSPTHLRWENMPGVCTNHEQGPMTGREVMQYVGTEIFRRMYGSVWSKSTVNKIVENNSIFSIITDCRFPNEVEAVHEVGGKVIRLTRSVTDSNDEHESEKALDSDRFEWDKFDAIVDNSNLSISETNEQIYNVLHGWGWVDYIERFAPKQ